MPKLNKTETIIMNDLYKAELHLISLYSELNLLNDSKPDEQNYLLSQIETMEHEVFKLKTEETRIVEQIEILWMNNPNWIVDTV